MDRITFEGQVVIVTGAGKGMGRAHARVVAGRGASVVVNDIDTAAADAVVEEIRAEGGKAAASHDSIITPEGSQAIVDTATGAFGTIDAIVNNAGFMRNGYFEDQTPTMLDAMLDVHVKGPFFLTQAAWPILRAKGYGRVVMISSGGGLFAMQGEANYAAAKAGIYGLCKALAFEGAEHGILVNTILPGANTTITANDPVPGMRERYSSRSTEVLRPRRQPEAVSAGVAYLASSACTVNGEAFLANAGMYSRVFVGVAEGWVTPDADAVTMDDVAAHLDQVRDLSQYYVPTDNYDHAENMARRVSEEIGA